MSASPYDAPLSALRNHFENLAVALAIWQARDDGKPDAHARRAGSTAIDAVDAMLRELHAIRAHLITEVRASDDATAIRADALLARTDDATTLSSDQASPWPAGLGKPKGRARCERPGPAKGNADEQE